MRPKLPSFEELTPYLREIDEHRYYSNGGPLSQRLEVELAKALGCPEDTIITVASATAGITAALLALNLPSNSVCLMPSWTFAATPHAALAAGSKPHFVDVDRSTWATDARAMREIANAVTGVGAVLTVSPFGGPIDIRGWERFQEESGIPVVVDAAAGFDALRASSLISVVSLHATKVLPAGEGGFVLAPTPAMRDRIRTCGNFGFNGKRTALVRAINSKMSEYHAAVALASLDVWPVTRLRHLQICKWYRQMVKGVPGVTLQPGYGDGWACGTTNIVLESDSAESIGRYLTREGIETRQWWSAGCHTQPAFASYEREDLAVTDWLGARVLGLPHFLEMEEAHVARVVRTLAEALRRRSRGSAIGRASRPVLL